MGGGWFRGRILADRGVRLDGLDQGSLVFTPMRLLLEREHEELRYSQRLGPGLIMARVTAIVPDASAGPQYGLLPLAACNLDGGALDMRRICSRVCLRAGLGWLLCSVSKTPCAQGHWQ
jgi:hypothetical protein